MTAADGHSDPAGILGPLPSGWRAQRLDRSRRASGYQGIYRIDSPERQIVIKVFGPKYGPMRLQMARLGNGLTGRSAPDLQSRYLTEKEALNLWRQNEFDVFQPAPQVPTLAVPEPFLALEYVSGVTLKNYFKDKLVPEDLKLAVLERFIPQWGRRHAVAHQQSNRHLIQEHASFKHVLLAPDGRLITFDFEEVFTGRHPLPFLIGREIAGYLRSLYRVLPAGAFDRYLDHIIQLYKPIEFLNYPYQFFFRHPNSILRLFHAFLRQLPANRRHNSRYGVIGRLHARLGQRI